MQMGGGNSESETMLNFLDLPHGNTFKKSTFSSVQSLIRKCIVGISNASMKEALEEEIKLSVSEELFERWKKGDATSKEVELTCSYDMGWNKRSSGHKYDSISGHGFLMGGMNKKILNHRCLSKVCARCSRAIKDNIVVEDHECPRNHDGSSKSMETEAIFQMVTEASHDLNYTVGTIISDDDSTMKSNLKWSYQEMIDKNKMKLEDWPKTKKGHKKKDHGRLPLDVKPPSFLADFNHRVKTVGKRFYELASAPKKTSMVNTALARRMKLNWGTMMKQVRHMDWGKEQKDIESKMSAPIEHVFGNHQYCGSWCYVLKAEREKKNYSPADNLPMYCKSENSTMYQQMNEAVETFKSKKNIKEILHPYDTQQNEALNMAVSRYVPKFKHYGTTMTLDTRVRCVIAAHNMSYSGFYSALLTDIGCIDDIGINKRPISSGIAKINDAKTRNKIRKQTPAYKRQRKYGLLAKTKQQIFEERVDRANKMGTYSSGVAVVDDEETETTKRQSSTLSNRICPTCKQKGHVTARSSKCLFHNEWLIAKEKKQSIGGGKKKRSDNNIALTHNSKNKKNASQNPTGTETTEKNMNERKSEKVLPRDSQVSSTMESLKSSDVPPLESGSYGTEHLKHIPQPTVVGTHTQDVCTPVDSIIFPTPVLEDSKKNTSTSTGVDSEVISKKRKIDSSQQNSSSLGDTVEFFVSYIDEECEMYSDCYSEDSDKS